ncbi:hypothetical protein, partial [Streptomyces sparsus]
MTPSPSPRGGAKGGTGPGIASPAGAFGDPSWFEVGETRWLAALMEQRVRAARAATAEREAAERDRTAREGDD